MSHYASREAAYGAAIARCASTLIQSGAPDDQAYRVAETIVNELAADGWQWRRREPEPLPRHQIRAAPSNYLETERKRLRDELEAATAAHRAKDKQPAIV